MSFLILILLISCTKENIVQPDNSQKGNISIAIDKANAPSNVAIVRATLTRTNFETIVNELNMFDNSASLVINNIVEGNWTLLVEAINQSDSVMFSATEQITIIAGQIIPITLVLSGGGQTGGLYLYVTWDLNNNNGWQNFSGNPIVSHSNIQPFVIHEDNKFKMWYSKLTGGYSASVYYAESNNGLIWNLYTQPVLSPNSFQWEELAVSVCMIKKENNQYIMYYTGTDYDSHYSIGRANSIDGLNWIKETVPVLTSTPNSWNNSMLVATSMIKINDVFYLYLSGRQNDGTTSIGLATSNDGINFTENPNNPIFTPNSDWESNSIYWPKVELVNDTWEMIYFGGISSSTGFAKATSPDGINWTRVDDKPFFDLSNQNLNYYHISYPHKITVNGLNYLYYTARTNNSENIICVAVK